MKWIEIKLNEFDSYLSPSIRTICWKIIKDHKDRG